MSVAGFLVQTAIIPNVEHALMIVIFAFFKAAQEPLLPVKSLGIEERLMATRETCAQRKVRDLSSRLPPACALGRAASHRKNSQQHVLVERKEAPNLAPEKLLRKAKGL